MACAGATNCNSNNFFPNRFGGIDAEPEQVYGLDDYVQSIAGSGINSPEVSGRNGNIADHGLPFAELSTSGPFHANLRTGSAERADPLTVRANGGLCFEFPGAADVTVRFSYQYDKVF